MSSYSSRKGLTWIHILFAIVLVVIVWVILVPIILRKNGPGYRTEALNNAKGIAGGLVVFKNDRGAFPCQFTRETLEESGIKTLPPGTSANAYLAQLIVTQIIDSETYFYASGMKESLRGDDLIETPEQLLAPGENSFAYVMAGEGKPLTDTQPHTPLVLAPVLTGGSNPTIDPKPYRKQFVYGVADGSGKLGTIDNTGRALTKDGKPLFATGKGTIFETDSPVVVMPTTR